MAFIVPGVGVRRVMVMLAWAAVASASSPKSIWIDTDPSAAPGGHEVDDGIALLQAFGSPELAIRGVSIVFGNADLPTAGRLGEEIVRRFGPQSVRVHMGAAGAQDLGKETEATIALERELTQSHLTVLALGPGTNIATVILKHPELAERIDEIIAVASRRPGQLFKSGERQSVPFRDFNFEMDPEAFGALLRSKIPLTFVPWEISSRVWLTTRDIRAAAAKSAGMAWLLPAITDWLALWKREFGTDGFNPFDTLAVGYLVDRSDLTCGAFSAGIEMRPDDTRVNGTLAPVKPYLIVRESTVGSRAVTYCYMAKPGFKTDLLRRLASKRN
jgi:Inosine-uridine nucleoside N-ribohydrolase